MIVLEGDREQTEHTMYKAGTRIIQHTQERLLRNSSEIKTRCHLNKQSLDKRVINHAFSGSFTIVNFAFILPPLLTQQTRLAFTIVKSEKSVTLKNLFTMVNFPLL